MKQTKHKILSVFLSFCMIISCMVGMTVTASATSPTPTEWYVGDTINLKGKYFSTVDNNAKLNGPIYSSIDKNVTVPTPVYSHEYHFWEFVATIAACDEEFKAGLMFADIPAGKTSADVPTGFRIMSGTGTSEDPYSFELIYDTKPITYKKPTVNASTHEVTFSDAQCSEYISVASSNGDVTCNAGWYVVSGNVSITGSIVIDGNVNLILCDGATLTTGKVGSNTDNASLTVYGQTAGTGKLNVNTANDAIKNVDLTVNGGDVTATTTGNYMCGVYNSNVTVNGGKLTVESGNVGIDIQDANKGVTVNGGTLSVSSTGDIAINSKGPVVVNGGSVTATGDNSFGYGILSFSDITINGGTVTASGRQGISADGDITVSDGTVNATGSISSGISSIGNITFGGGTVTASSTGSNAIYANNDINFSGAAGVTATTTENAPAVVAPNGGIYFKNGAAGVTGADSSNTSAVAVENKKATSEIGKYFTLAHVDTYTITFTNGGTASVDDMVVKSAVEGATVTIVADKPVSGTEFNGWTTTTEGVTFTNASAVTTTFTMPAADVEITASYQTTAPAPVVITKYKITMSNGGKAYVNDEEVTEAEEGATVRIAADEPASGTEFNGWTSSTEGVIFEDASAATTTFKMPASDVEITASYQETDPTPTPTPEPTPTPYIPPYIPTPVTTTTPAVEITKYNITGKQDAQNVNALTWDTIPDASAYSLYIKVGDKYVFVQDLGTATNADVVLSTSGKYYVSTGDDYNVYTYDSKKGTFTQTGTWKASKIENVKKANNVTENFMVKYTVNGTESTESNSYKTSVKIYYKPALDITAGDGFIRVNWAKVDGAEKYRAYKVVNGKLKFIIETDKLALRVNGTKAGREYAYAVKAFVNGEWTTVYKSDVVSVTAK